LISHSCSFLLNNFDRSSDVHQVEQLDDIIIEHPDTAVRCGLTYSVFFMSSMDIDISTFSVYQATPVPAFFHAVEPEYP
jgi:hypothetical protein